MTKKRKADGGGEAKAAKAKAELYKTPDAQEVLEIARTRNLYKSNLFRLQLEELIKELAPRKSPPGLEAALHGLKPLLLEKLHSREIPANFAAEFPELRFQLKSAAAAALGFAAPKRLDVVGSFLLGTHKEQVVDVAVEMPSEMFRSKDYLNFRYHDKRAAYVGELHRQLPNLLQGDAALAPLKAEFEALQGDPLRPCLALRPPEGRWAIRLLPSYAAELWPARVLAPDRNAVRPEGDKKAQKPTAQYNSCVLEDARMREHLETLHEAAAKFAGLKDAIRLLKRWALCCGFMHDGEVFTPLSGFMLSMLCAHAAQTGHVAPQQTSSFQLFKLALSVLANTPWREQKVIYGTTTPVALSTMEQEVCAAHFYDAAGALNFFWRLGPVVEELCWEAQRALRILDAQADPFDAVFGRDAAPELAWDLVLRTPQLGGTCLCPDLRTDSSSASGASAVPSDAPEAMALAELLRTTMLAGLGDRCVRAAVRLMGQPRPRWQKVAPEGVAVMLGLALAPENLERVIDRGPSAQEEEAAQAFRRLWGEETSELRRFKDGSILECVVWKKPAPGRTVEARKQPAVVTQIVHHLLARHLPPHLSPLSEAVSGPVGFVENLGEKERRVWGTFETFRTHLCQLSSLPLAIKEVHPVDSAFSYMSVHTQLAPPAPSGSDAELWRPLFETVLEFEASGRWPEETAAAQKVAGALLLQIREELGSDLGIEADATEAYLDVRYPEAVFRLRVFHPHELAEAANKVTNLQAANGPSGGVSEEELRRLRGLWWLPRLRGALHAHALQLPALAGAARLVKRWMGSQMMSGYEEFAEHLAAFVFLHPAPFDAPTSAHLGFCRVLWLLKTFDWQREALIIDIDGKINEQERLGLRQSFEQHLAKSPPLSFWVVSRLDPHCLLLPTPGTTLTAWLQKRAGEALRMCHRRMLGLESTWRGVFQLELSAFDVLLRLLPQDQAALIKGDQAKAAKGAKGAAQATQEATLDLVRGLQEKLSPLFLVLFDAQRQLLALKCRPGAFLPQGQAVLAGAAPHTVIQGKDVLCVPNILCVLSQVSALAEGLALEVVMQPKS